MALTLTQLVEAAQKYVGRDDPKSIAALKRNLDLLAGRVAAVAVAAKALAPEAPEVLSSDPGTALHQILAATGHPVQVIDGRTQAIDPGSVLDDATPEQIRELALLGFFGQSAPNPIKGVDYSLFDRYYEHDAPNHWQPKAEYMNTGTWQSYIASKS